MKLLIAMYMQIQFELILTSNKAPIDNLRKKTIFSNGRHSFEKGPPKGNPSQILIRFSSFNGKGLNMLFFIKICKF